LIDINIVYDKYSEKDQLTPALKLLFEKELANIMVIFLKNVHLLREYSPGLPREQNILDVAPEI